MDKRTCVIDAIEHRPNSDIPHCIGFTSQERQIVASYLGNSRFVEEIGNFLSSVYYDGYLSELTPGSGYWRDDFGVVWNRNGADKDIGVIDGILLPEPELGAYRFPELDEKRIRQGYDELQARNDGTFKFGSIGFSLFERAWSLRGMVNILTDMILEPEFVDGLLDAITDYNLKIIDIALEYNIDGFLFGDDWGQQRGLIMGPGYWRRFIKPRLARLYGRIKEKGRYVLQHSCGDIREIMPDLVEIGLDVYQTVQPEIYDLPELKREFGQKLTFWGAISTQRLLPFASPAEVRRVTRETIRIMSAGGGYIIAPTHAIPGDVPPENVVAMLEVILKHDY